MIYSSFIIKDYSWRCVFNTRKYQSFGSVLVRKLFIISVKEDCCSILEFGWIGVWNTHVNRLRLRSVNSSVHLGSLMRLMKWDLHCRLLSLYIPFYSPHSNTVPLLSRHLWYILLSAWAIHSKTFRPLSYSANGAAPAFKHHNTCFSFFIDM